DRRTGHKHDAGRYVAHAAGLDAYPAGLDAHPAGPHADPAGLDTYPAGYSAGTANASTAAGAPGAPTMRAHPQDPRRARPSIDRLLSSAAFAALVSTVPRDRKSVG